MRSGKKTMNTPFHQGELQVQARAQSSQMAARVGTGIRDFIASGAAQWLEEQVLAAVASRDGDGAMWASILTGLPGFIQVKNEYEVGFIISWLGNAVLYQSLLDGAVALGAVVLEPATRKRMRLNGQGELTSDGFRLFVAEVYGNCPKYIQTRTVSSSSVAVVPCTETGTVLSPAQLDFIGKADTFFMATGHPERGADCSHRGGSPGFVRATGQHLEWEDYPGNAMFNSLGNLQTDPRCGLAFLDWESGATLQLTGRAQIRWEGETRFVEFGVESWRETQGATAQRWEFGAYSPFKP
jgi:predicted pyridoxine 5'-phosphate oxidase superfamily flavin-nucleotide-binding protein